MKNKKVFWIVVIVLVVTLLAIVVVRSLKRGSVRIEDYSKYSLVISIDSTKNGVKKNILLNVMNDGKSVKVLSTNGLDTYIIGDYLYYLKERTFYKCKVNTSYEDIYSKLASLKYDYVGDVGEYSKYQAKIEASDANSLLEMLFFGMKTKRSTLLDVSIKDNKIEEANLSFGDIGEYEVVKVNIKYKVLEDDYKIDTSRIYGGASLAGGIVYKQEETKENPYMIFEN